MKARPLRLVLAAAVLFATPLAARPVSGIAIEAENVRLCTTAGGGGKSCLQAASTTPVPGQVFGPGEILESEVSGAKLSLLVCHDREAVVVAAEGRFRLEFGKNDADTRRWRIARRLGAPCYLPNAAAASTRYVASGLPEAVGPSPERDRDLVNRLGPEAAEQMLRLSAESPLSVEASWLRVGLLQEARQWDSAMAALLDFRNRHRHKEVIDPVLQRLQEERASAENAQARTASAACALDPAKTKTVALLVGVSVFTEEQRLSKLNYADDDALLLRRVLETHITGAPADIKLLRDGQATKDTVDQALDGVEKLTDKDTVVWLFFASHGEVRDGRAVLHLHGSKTSGKLPSLDVPTLEGRIATLARKSCQVNVVYDVCHAGALSGTTGEVVTKRENARVIEELRKNPAVQPVFLFVAALEGTAAYEHSVFKVGEDTGEGHGVFTYYLAQRLLHAESPVTWAGVRSRVIANVSEATKTLQQSDVFRRRIGNQDLIALPPQKPFAFPKGEPQVPADALDRKPRPLSDSPASTDELSAWRTVNIHVEGRDGELTPTDFQQCAKTFKRLWGERIQSAAQEVLYRFCHGRALGFEPANFDQARLELETAIRLQPDGAFLWNAIGVLWLEQGNYNRAVPYFQYASKLSPDWAFPRLNLALTLIQQGEYEAAAREYERAAKIEPALGYLKYNQALLNLGLGEDDAARGLLRRLAAKSGPYQADALTALGAIELRRGRRKRAQDLFQAALQSNARYAPAKHNLAAMALADNRPSAARTLLQENVDARYVPSMAALADHLAPADPARALELYCQAIALERLPLAQAALAQRRAKLPGSQSQPCPPLSKPGESPRP